MALAVRTMLMFEGRAEEAMNLYVSLFSGSHIESVDRYGRNEGGREGTIRKADFILAGHPLSVIDSHLTHAFSFTPSVSLVVTCEDENEFDAAFRELAKGGEVLMPPDDYGFSRKFTWVNDRFGVSWQLVLS